jgi:hypothetical protein
MAAMAMAGSPATPSFAVTPRPARTTALPRTTPGTAERSSAGWWRRTGDKLRPQFSVNLSDFIQRGTTQTAA